MLAARDKRVLWVTEEVPDAGGGGGNIRQARLFLSLAATIPTDLLVVGVVKDQAVRAAAASVTELPERRAPWTAQPILRRVLELGITFASRYPIAMYPALPARYALSRALGRDKTRHAVVCVESESLVPLARAITRGATVLTFHFLLSEMVAQELAHTRGIRHRWFLERERSKARRVELMALRRYDRVITCSEQDRDRLLQIGGAGLEAKVTVIPNGVAVAKSAEPRSHPSHEFCFQARSTTRPTFTERSGFVAIFGPGSRPKFQTPDSF